MNPAQLSLTLPDPQQPDRVSLDSLEDIQNYRVQWPPSPPLPALNSSSIRNLDAPLVSSAVPRKSNWVQILFRPGHIAPNDQAVLSVRREVRLCFALAFILFFMFSVIFWTTTFPAILKAQYQVSTECYVVNTSIYFANCCTGESCICEATNSTLSCSFLSSNSTEGAECFGDSCCREICSVPCGDARIDEQCTECCDGASIEHEVCYVTCSECGESIVYYTLKGEEPTSDSYQLREWNTDCHNKDCVEDLNETFVVGKYVDCYYDRRNDDDDIDIRWNEYEVSDPKWIIPFVFFGLGFCTCCGCLNRSRLFQKSVRQLMTHTSPPQYAIVSPPRHKSTQQMLDGTSSTNNTIINSLEMQHLHADDRTLRSGLNV